MKRPVVVAGVVGVLGVLGACSDQTSTAVPPVPVSAVETARTVPPKPDEETTQHYIAALNAIDPIIVNGKTDRAVDRGRNQCSSIREGFDEPKLISLTQQRFSGLTELSVDQASKILDTIRRYLCPTG